MNQIREWTREERDIVEGNSNANGKGLWIWLALGAGLGGYYAATNKGMARMIGVAAVVVSAGASAWLLWQQKRG